MLSLLLGTVMGFALLPPAVGADAGLPMRVTFEGTPVNVSPGATVGQLLDQMQRFPQKGNLVSVTGRILRQDVVSGLVLVDGKPAPIADLLAEGSVVTLQRGPDVREPVERVRAAAVGVGNPIRSVPAYYGLPVYVVRGTISKEVIKETGAPGTVAKAAVALTFDDGPDPNWTPRILAVLKRYGIKATFFTTARNMQRYPAIVRALRSAGMSIQNHSYNHENMGKLSPAQQHARLIAHIQTARAMGLPFPRWFRPPYGVYSLTTVRIARQLGMRTVIWSADPADYSRPAASVIARRVLSQTRAGGVVLMHDAGGNRANTLAALPTIIQALQSRGYRFITLD